MYGPGEAWGVLIIVEENFPYRNGTNRALPPPRGMIVKTTRASSGSSLTNLFQSSKLLMG